MDNLNIDEKEAEALIRGGFLTFDDIAYAEDGKLSSAMEIDEARAEEIKAAAADAALMEALGEITQEELNLEFSTKELATEYAKKNKIDFEIIEPQKRKTIKKSYADNFLK